ncbi:DUF2690 domain-containing protein, partial [Bacillus licheniformis]|uniref:DUF2690 domain-containing protein n=1 Tax=Bacillus licheniformis TaxID=1402 RepID=UPI00237C6C99
TKATARLIDANNKQFGIAVLKLGCFCKTAWAKMTRQSSALRLGGKCICEKKQDGKELSGSSAGGNGKVLPGQTSCYTPMVYVLDPRSSYAMRKYYHSSSETLAYA